MSFEADGSRSFKRQGRWALMMHFFSVFSLLMCAAFAEQAARKLGVPSFIVYVLAGLAWLLCAVLHMNADATGASWPNGYPWMARILALLLIILNVYMGAFIFEDGKGHTLTSGSYTQVIPPTPLWQVAASIATFAVICLLALFALWRLVASVRGNTQA